ncbi:MAG: hypothetical protein KKD74_00700 [Bacteroidetes bacterium]|nr:hypothetical protein [Bacteroidota bacterium]
MKKNGLLLFLLLIISGSFAQHLPEWQETDKLILSFNSKHLQSIGQLSQLINANFDTDRNKVRAIYVWLAYNIRYDTRNSDGLTREETDQEIIEKTFQNRKGICEGYAGIMDSICRLSGIRSYVISGYTRQDGVTDPLPHAWVATKVDGYWYLSDPTWGAGSVENRRFVQEFDARYFMVPPQTMIKTHMPYDPIWQFLKFPVSHTAFCQNLSVKEKPVSACDFQDSIRQFEAMTSEQQLLSEMRRIGDTEHGPRAIDIRLHYLREALKVLNNNKAINLYNLATNAYNSGVARYNDFAEFMNRHQESKSYALSLKKILTEASGYLDQSLKALSQINNPPVELRRNMLQLQKSVDQLQRRINNERDKLNG